MNSYQKLKKENSKLKSEIHQLITNPNSLESEMIRARHKISYEQFEEMLFGNYDQQHTFTTFDGLITTAYGRMGNKNRK